MYYVNHGFTTSFFLFLAKAATLCGLIVFISIHTWKAITLPYHTYFRIIYLCRKTEYYAFNSDRLQLATVTEVFPQKALKYMASKIAFLCNMKVLLPSITFKTEALSR